ncbi:MAG TPA: L-rhamnose isomerase [Candidatus Saccharicenans sp.]|jgi:L-rhamnose isomerase|nr:L-rhamnose isomerase [Candidatus Saccharicenans sp.]HRD02389.1 L-rhamnose isomerase [Candidatus Saccharicenans sp.]
MDYTSVEKKYNEAREKLAETGVKADEALQKLEAYQLSIHCWQGDDLRGFEQATSELTGSGLQVTGNYPGRPRNVEELRQDLEKALSLIPGRHRLNLHSIYGEFDGPVERNEYEPGHFRGWLEWAKALNLKLDFNATCFAHPKAASGLTLSHPKKEIRKFWIEHVKACRKIAAFFGRELKSYSIHNLWIPDGLKDWPANRWLYRHLLFESLEEIFETEYSQTQLKDSLESKLFGLGSEAYVVGSHEFYLSYAQKKGKMICLDLGHFHPTESIPDKISGLMTGGGELLLHFSRGIRWDSDHVVLLNDDIEALCEEVVAVPNPERIHLALDYFDASMNRVGAWVLGARAVERGLLRALLLPKKQLEEAELKGDNLEKLYWRQYARDLPFGAVWDYYCLTNDIPLESQWLEKIKEYEKAVLHQRD